MFSLFLQVEASPETGLEDGRVHGIRSRKFVAVFPLRSTGRGSCELKWIRLRVYWGFRTRNAGWIPIYEWFE